MIVARFRKSQWAVFVAPRLRGVLLKGVGMRDLWTQLGVLSAAALVLLIISVRRFSKTLD